MKKLLGYGAGLALLKSSMSDDTIEELWDALTMKEISSGITSNMDLINKEIQGLSRISFNVGSGKISFKNLISYFSNKVSNLWFTGETVKVIIGMILLVAGVISLVVAPIITAVRYIINGIKNKNNFNFKLRNLFMYLGIEATIGSVLVLFFIRALNW